MYLKKIKCYNNHLKTSPSNFKNLKAYLVEDFNNNILKTLVDFGLNIFGELGMDEWGLVPQIRHGNVYLLRNESSNAIIGLAIFMRDWEDIDKCYLFDYAIKENLQGQGIGYFFLDTLCKHLKDTGFKNISLTVDINNKPAIRLYRDKMGFKVKSFNKNEYGKDHDRFVMELNLLETVEKSEKLNEAM